MKTEQMSSLTRSLYSYECQYLNDAAQDKTLTGPIKASLLGRVVFLAISFILHAEAVCRAVYVCFLTIKQIFSQSTQELLAKQKGECTVAYDASLRSFGAALFYQKLITSLDETRSTSLAPQVRTLKPPMKKPQAPQQGLSAAREESSNDAFKDSDCRAPQAERAELDPMPNRGSGQDYEYQSVSQPSHLRIDGASLAGSAAVMVEVDDCHFPESPEMQPLFGNIDAISLSGSPESFSPVARPQVAHPDNQSQAGSEPVLVDGKEQRSPDTKPQAEHLVIRSQAGSEPSLVDGHDPISPRGKPQLANLAVRSQAGSEPVLVDGQGQRSPVAKSQAGHLVIGSQAGSEPSLVDEHEPISSRDKPQLANLDIRSLAESDPSLVDGDEGKDLVSPKAQLFADIDIRSNAGSEPSLINGQPLKSSASSELDFILVKPEDIDRMRATAEESRRLGKEVERMEEEGQKYQALQLELELAKRQVKFLNKKLEQVYNENNLEMLAADHPSVDGELVEILNEYEREETVEAQALPAGTAASVHSFDVLSRSSDPIPVIIKNEKSATEAKAPLSPRSQSSGELV